MFDLVDIFAHAIYVGLIVGGFFLVVAAFMCLGWKYWHVVIASAIVVYWIM